MELKPTLESLLSTAQMIAEAHHDGHLTIMRFTTDWRVGFGTVSDRLGDGSEGLHHPEIKAMSWGRTLEEALRKAIIYHRYPKT